MRVGARMPFIFSWVPSKTLNFQHARRMILDSVVEASFPMSVSNPELMIVMIFYRGDSVFGQKRILQSCLSGVVVSCLDGGNTLVIACIEASQHLRLRSSSSIQTVLQVVRWGQKEFWLPLRTCYYVQSPAYFSINGFTAPFELNVFISSDRSVFLWAALVCLCVSGAGKPSRLTCIVS